MTTLNLALDVIQFAALLALSAANGVIAYSVFRIQKDRNTPKLVVYVELVEDDDHEYLGLYVQNVGLVVSHVRNRRDRGGVIWFGHPES